MRSGFAAFFCVPCWKRAYLDANVVVLFFCHVNKYSEEGKDRARAEEGALWPDYSCWQKTQENCQNPVEGLPEHTLPVPLWGNTQTYEGNEISATGPGPHMLYSWSHTQVN